jgi:asparagine synthase (glutamine-hydrolysing)
MCGINGIWSFGQEAPPIDREELLRTREAMTSRGPDAAGAWVSADGRMGLAACRLAILDLSPAGTQPMPAESGSLQAVFNGEIYNFRELRAELEAKGVRFRSRSDTEVVLALYLRHGAAMLQRLRGMFALAIWDERDGRARRLLLARDPFGIKPLYYAAAGGQLRFASQLKALEAGGAVSREIDPAGLAGFLLWGSVPEPWTIRPGVRCLPAGCSLTIEEGQPPAEPRPFAVLAGQLDPLWAARGGQVERLATAEPAPLTPEAAIVKSVEAHLVSDVPIAIFLSAGLDSGLVAAIASCKLASRNPPEQLTTFTLSFPVLAGTSWDEAPLAADVARSLRTRHIERSMGVADLLSFWPEALKAMDQPSIDGFNTYAVSRAAHQEGLKVVLSGLGGDELFGSYPSFAEVPWGMRAARWGRRLPGLDAAWEALAGRLVPSRPKLSGLLRHGATLAGSYFLRRALFLPEELPALMGADAADEGLAAYDPVADAGKLIAAEAPSANGHQPLDPWIAVQLMESSQYLRNQLLRDSDWASMAWSVELRVPLVDAQLHRRLAASGFEHVRRLGKADLVRRIARRLATELPGALWSRKKTGFYLPVLESLLPGEFGPATHNLGRRSRELAKLVLAGGWDVHLPGAPAC